MATSAKSRMIRDRIRQALDTDPTNVRFEVLPVNDAVLAVKVYHDEKPLGRRLLFI